jgi:hypothetical protein
MVTVSPFTWQDDPGPEDLQAAFMREQQAATRDFQQALGRTYPAMNGGTPNEPERELSAAEVRDILQDLTATVQYLCDMAYIRAADKWDAARAQVYGAKVKQLAERLQDAPPY